jgi:hypothetical protein
LIATLLLTLPGIAVAAAPDPSVAEGKHHFDQGVALFNDGDFNGALAEFDASYKIHAASGVLYNIGLVHKALFHYDEALGYLRRYLTESKKLPKPRKAEVTQQIREIEALLATITFAIAPDGASVSLDKRVLGTAPLKPYGVAAGSHVFAVTLDGYKPLEKTLVVVAGQPQTLSVTLEKIPTTGKVRVRVTPALAQVIVDDKPRGMAPVEIELPIGGHTLTVQSAGYTTYQGELVVSGGQTRDVPIEMVKPVVVRKAHVYEKWYFWVPITAVVAGAVATGLGVGLTQPSPVVGTLPTGAARVQ